MRHFYRTCVLALDKNVEPHVLLTSYLPPPPETMRDISARGSQHVDEEFGGWGWYSAHSISRHGHGTDHLVNYLLVSKKKGDWG
jgi:hypothetical protein